MALRLHQVQVKAIVEILQRSMFDGEHVGYAVSDVLQRNRKFGSRDRNFIAETTQDLVRNFRLCAELTGQDYEDVETDLWLIFGCWWLLQGHELPDRQEFAVLKDLKPDMQSVQTNKAILLSMPDWLYNYGHELLGQRWDTELKAMLQPARLVIRVNSSKTTVEILRKKLLAYSLETVAVDGAPDALVLSRKRNLQEIAEFKAGLFEVQDAGSQLVAPMLRVQPGMTVVDACAGAGGKSLHIADLMRDQGAIYSLDVSQAKLKNLKLRVERSGIKCIHSAHITDQQLKDLEHKADRILLDVPCSGLGVLKRNPDTKWRLTSEELDELVQTQQAILSRYHHMLKPGGLLLYVTCSILPVENEQQVATFLEAHKDYSLVKEQHVWPSEFGFDGFYMALLQKS